MIYLLKTTLRIFQESEFSVTRQHEEFIWLHDQFNENEEYAGLIVSNYIRFTMSIIQSLNDMILNYVCMFSVLLSKILKRFVRCIYV